MLFNALHLHTGRIKYIASGMEHFPVANNKEKKRERENIRRKTTLNLTWLYLYSARSKITQLLTTTHAQLQRHRLKFIKKKHLKLLHVSVYDHLQGVTISSLKSLLFKHSCMYTNCGGVAAYL